jgi:hypothetical protein
VAGSSLFRANNAEWQPPDFSLEFWPLFLMAPLMVLGAWRSWRSQPGLAAIALLFLVMAFGSRRLIPWAAVVGLPLLAQGMEALRNAAYFKSVPPALRRILPVGLAFAGMVYGASVAQLSRPAQVQSMDLGLRADPSAYPAAMAARLRSLAPGGRVFNDYNHGGYLHLAVGPTWLVGMDGRNDLYGEEAVRHYEALVTGRAPALEELDRHSVDAALLSWPMALAPGGIYQQLAPDPRWACAGFDDAAILMVRRRSIPPETLAPVELKHFIPILTDEANIRRATTQRTLPQMRRELDALLQTAPSERGITAALQIARALQDTPAIERLERLTNQNK